MDKDLALQIGVAAVITVIVFAIGVTVVNSVMDMDASIENMRERFNATFCSNLTQETVNTTPNSNWCIYNESSEKYELAPVKLQNGVVT
jgi:hypothetical protein